MMKKVWMDDGERQIRCGIYKLHDNGAATPVLLENPLG
jgi:hypothetical protein